MYAMITMFVINTGTANAEDETEFNKQQIQTIETGENDILQTNPANDTINQSTVSENTETGDINNTNDNTDIIENADNTKLTSSDEQIIEQGAVAEAVQEGADSDVDKASDTDEVSGSDQSVKGSKSSKAKNSSNKKSVSKNFNKSDLRLLSAIIYCEAGNEPYAGKVAVGIVVMNRKASSAFPNSIKGVIYQPYQFSPVRNGALKKALKKYDAGKFTSTYHKQCIKAAKEALSGVKSVNYNGKKIDCSKFKFFSGGLKGAKVTIKGHRFK
jgi:hypothetical protein